MNESTADSPCYGLISFWIGSPLIVLTALRPLPPPLHFVPTYSVWPKEAGRIYHRRGRWFPVKNENWLINKHTVQCSAVQWSAVEARKWNTNRGELTAWDISYVGDLCVPWMTNYRKVEDAPGCHSECHHQTCLWYLLSRKIIPTITTYSTVIVMPCTSKRSYNIVRPVCTRQELPATFF